MKYMHKLHNPNELIKYADLLNYKGKIYSVFDLRRIGFNNCELVSYCYQFAFPRITVSRMYKKTLYLRRRKKGSKQIRSQFSYSIDDEFFFYTNKVLFENKGFNLFDALLQLEKINGKWDFKCQS